jgi:protein-tyrosine phosphatase
MISRVLVLCTGNICRSPVAEAVLRAALPDRAVASAGLHAVVGHDIDAQSAEAARMADIALAPHAARQFTEDMGREADVILVMEAAQRRDIAARWPQFLGKTFLLSHFAGGADVPDPYREPIGYHVRAVELIGTHCAGWVKQIKALDR